MGRPTDNLAAAKAILETPVGDLGDFEVAEAQARATVALAENVGEVVELLTALMAATPDQAERLRAIRARARAGAR